MLRTPVPVAPTSNAGPLSTVLLSAFMATLAVSSVNVLLPELVVTLHSTYGAVQWVVVAYMTAIASFVVVGGHLSDMFGRRRVYLVGVMMFTLAAVGCWGAKDIVTLSAFRALQGVGAACLLAVNLALLAELAPEGKSGAWIGLLGSVSAAGTASGPVVGGLFASYAGWRSVFLLNLPLGATAYLLALRYLPKGESLERAEDFDTRGALLLVVGVTSCALGVEALGERPRSVVAGVLVCSLISLGLFLRRTRYHPRPLIEASIVTDRQVREGLLQHMLVAAIVMTALVIGPFYLTASLQLGLAQVGLVMAVSPVVVTATSVVVGARMRPGNYSAHVAAGIGLLLAGVIGLAVLDRSMGVAGFIACLATTAVGYATFKTANNTALMSAATPEQQGQVSGLLNLTRNLGLLLGATLMSGLFDHLTRASQYEQLPPEVAESGLNRVYYAVALLAIAALVVGIRSHSSRRSEL